jgi:hypothetical protein
MNKPVSCRKFVFRKKTIFLCLLALLIWSAEAQELDEIPPALKDRAIVLQITTKVHENNKEVWNANNSKVTIPGRPVSIKLVGENLIIEIQLTPNMRSGKYTLDAKSQIWIEIPGKGMSYRPANHSTPIVFGEQILYLPLGSDASSDTPRIELLITMHRYADVSEELESQ